jgi:hypothetical protein
MTKKRVPPEISEYFVKFGKQGGKKKVPKGLAKLSTARKKAIAKKGAEARWGKKPKRP